MDMFSSAKLEKAVIRAYRIPERVGNCKEYQCMFNPDSYSMNVQHNFIKKKGVNASEEEAEYSNSISETLSFKIIIDGTGVDDEYSFANANALTKEDSKRVAKDIRFFREEIMAYDGEIHQPRYLVVNWGDLHFPCRLNTARFNFTHFSTSGKPLRAEIDVDFFYQRPKEIVEAEAVKSSPDLTHVRTVKAQDQLPLMCERIYGSSRYYLWVAKINQLDDFRNLSPGQEIYFPPLEK